MPADEEEDVTVAPGPDETAAVNDFVKDQSTGVEPDLSAGPMGTVEAADDAIAAAGGEEAAELRAGEQAVSQTTSPGPIDPLPEYEEPGPPVEN